LSGGPGDADAAGDRHRRVKQVFLEALELAPGRRAAFLARICAGDDGLHREVLELFLLHGEQDSVLDAPLDGRDALADLAASGDVAIGPYRLVRELGRGGMGVVHLAERDGRIVALKLLAAGAFSSELRERFRLEAEILRRLEHPGIARLLEVGEAPGPGGVTRPWIAMEHVEGLPLLRHAAASGLSLEGRLRLLLAVCDAVQHAHERGVVHRDLKPSNILVRADGRPVVLDFGVARLVAGDERPTELATRTGQLVGTPQYMSPEQVQAVPAGIGPASDVYSLGVILYELVSGQVPYEASSVSLHRAVVSILTAEPRPLGQAAPEARGPLERIVGMALEKDPRHRYPDAGSLGDDLRRRLEGRSVRAKGPNLARRVVRWSARRQRLAASVALLLVAGAVTLAWWLGRERTVPDAFVRATYLEAESLIAQAEPILYDGERSPERLREVVELLGRARILLGQVPPLRHHGVLLRRLEKDLGTAEMLLGELTWDIRPASQAVVTLEHARSLPAVPEPGALDDQQVKDLGFQEVSNAELLSLVAGAQSSLYRLWGRGGHLEQARQNAIASLEEHRTRAEALGGRGLPGPYAPVGDRFAYAFNQLAEVHTDLARFRRSAEVARQALAWSDSAWNLRLAFSLDWPALGSMLYERSRAFRTLGEISRDRALLDSAGRYLEACSAYRGPDRPRIFAETHEESARLELARAGTALGMSARVRHLLMAIHDLDTAGVALVAAGASAPQRAWLRALQASPFTELARATGAEAWLDSAAARLLETSGAFSATSLPRQASSHWLRRGMVDRARFELSGATEALASARSSLDHARSLATSRRDSLVLERAVRERELLEAEARRRGLGER
jgi:predicted Ser/Thr protein kinase